MKIYCANKYNELRQYETRLLKESNLEETNAIITLDFYGYDMKTETYYATITIKEINVKYHMYDKPTITTDKKTINFKKEHAKQIWKSFAHIVREYNRNWFDFFYLDDISIFRYIPDRAKNNRVQNMNTMIKTNKDIAFKWYSATPCERKKYFKLELELNY